MTKKKGRPSTYTGEIAVYALKDECGAIRYIGVTRNPADRLARHIRESRARKTKRHCWIASMVSRGLKPDLEVLEHTTDWDDAERRWIRKCLEDGCRLTNGNAGGKTMRQARERSECYPALKRFWRRFDGAIRAAVNANPEKKEHLAKRKQEVRDAVERVRKRGPEAMEALNERLEQRFG